MKSVVYIPTANVQLNPYIHGNWVESTEENKRLSQERWQSHKSSTVEDLLAAANR